MNWHDKGNGSTAVSKNCYRIVQCTLLMVDLRLYRCSAVQGRIKRTDEIYYAKEQSSKGDIEEIGLIAPCSLAKKVLVEDNFNYFWFTHSK